MVKEADHFKHLSGAIGEVAAVQGAQEGPVQEHRQWRAVGAQLVLLLVEIDRCLDAY